MNKSPISRVARHRGAVVGALILAIILLMAVAAPYLFPTSPWRMVQRPFVPPFTLPGLPLGTDSLGRNIAACLAHGTRISLLVGVVSTMVALLIGVPIGALAGYYGRRVDDFLMRGTELFQTIPSFALAIVLVAILQPSLSSLIIAIALVSWPPVARLVRAEVMSIQSREYVQAAIVVGQTHLRVILTQVLPNILSPIIVLGSLMVATAILLESSLSFLGLGDPDVMSWGYMVGASRNFVRQAWWMSAIPGIAILLTVLAINLVGEGLNDALNPRLAREGR